MFVFAGGNYLFGERVRARGTDLVADGAGWRRRWLNSHHVRRWYSFDVILNYLPFRALFVDEYFIGSGPQCESYSTCEAKSRRLWGFVCSLFVSWAMSASTPRDRDKVAIRHWCKGLSGSHSKSRPGHHSSIRPRKCLQTGYRQIICDVLFSLYPFEYHPWSTFGVIPNSPDTWNKLEKIFQ